MIRRLVPVDCAPVGVISQIARQNPCQDGGLSVQCPRKSSQKKVKNPMRPALILPLVLAACTMAPLATLTDPAQAQKRGQVEIIVKSDYDAIRGDIGAGGGPALNAAMDAAGVPAQDRPTRVIQLQANMGLYDATPSALITALLVYGA